MKRKEILALLRLALFAGYTSGFLLRNPGAIKLPCRFQNTPETQHLKWKKCPSRSAVSVIAQSTAAIATDQGDVQARRNAWQRVS